MGFFDTIKDFLPAADLVAPGLGTGLKAAIGLGQTIAGGLSSATNQRLEYQISAAAQTAMGLAMAHSNSNMPNYNLQQDRIGLASANAYGQALQTGNVLGSIGGIQAQENKGYQDLSMQNATYRDSALNQYGQALNTYGDHQDQQWQINKFALYADRQKQANQLIGGGIANLTGALDSYEANNLKQNEINSLNGIDKRLVSKNPSYLSIQNQTPETLGYGNSNMMQQSFSGFDPFGFNNPNNAPKMNLNSYNNLSLGNMSYKPLPFF
jgi:hypothetical protein